MRRLHLTTGGESHGPGLTAILTGMPAGLRVDLARRQHGYQAGWWALGRAFLYVAGKLLVGSAAAVLVVQLGLQVMGGPNVPGLSASCGNPV
jgi:hypothetical protein